MNISINLYCIDFFLIIIKKNNKKLNLIKRQTLLLSFFYLDNCIVLLARISNIKHHMIDIYNHNYCYNK